MNKLFEEQWYGIEGPQEHNHDSYIYYAGSLRPEIIDARKQMEEWFALYPDAEKNDLRNNFKNDFDAGFFELFLYTLFYKMGYKITIHPEVPDSTKKPDFLVSGFGEEFYLEAKVSYYESKDERSKEKMLGSLYSILNKAVITDFYIYLRNINLKTGQQPRSNKIRKAIEDTINSYGVDELLENMNNGKITNPPIHVYEDDDIYIEYGPIPRSVEARGKAGHRAIGIYGGDAKILENAESLRGGLKVKAGRYGSLDKPFLIAINAIDMMSLDKNDVMDCLMGTTCVVPELVKNSEQIQEYREHDGFFTGRNDQGQNTRVSAAFITKINHGNWRDSEYWIIENEKANNYIGLRKSDLITRFIEDGTIYRTKGKSFGEIIE